MVRIMMESTKQYVGGENYYLSEKEAKEQIKRMKKLDKANGYTVKYKIVKG